MKSSVRTTRQTAGFTLAEVLAALMFMAVVVPIAIGALHVAALSGEVATRKAVAARIADRVLNEAVVTAANGEPASQSGVATENGLTFNWNLRYETWPVTVTSTSSMQVVTVDVGYTAQGQKYNVRLSTLAGPQ